MLRKFIGDRTESTLNGFATYLHKRGITPNILTITGLVVNTAGAYAYYRGFVVLGGFVILFAGLFDMMDGAVARAGGTASSIGAFTDAVVDRYSDFIIFAGVLAYFAGRGNLGKTMLVLVIMCGSLLVSYVRARAELVIPKCDVGLMERPERIILLGAGSILGFFNVALWLLALLTHLTAFHRVYFTYKTHRRSVD